MSVKKVKTTITYRVPDGSYCNLDYTAHLCRFAVKERHGYRCALYNYPLDTSNDKMPLKTRDCIKATCGFKSVVEDVPMVDNGPIVDPKQLMKMTIDEYNKVLKQLKSQGYPDAIAERVAKEYMLGGK